MKLKSINNRIFFLLICCTFLIGFTEITAQKKNIVFLFADDAGYNDFGFQGSKYIKTPNLDKLAKEGVIFKEAYTTAAVCGPSRAGLLTGMYQQRFGFEENNVTGYMSASSKLMAQEMGLPLHLKTIANHLNPLGYKSVIFGKWHMGNADKYHPLKRGFDEFHGFRGGARSFHRLTQKEIEQKPEARWEDDFENFSETDEYITDRIANTAVDFMERNQKNPFFMYVSFNAVHAPQHFIKEDLEKVKHLKGKRRKLAAMTIALDRACGQILDKLKKLGLEKNTLVVFANDNGGADGITALNYPLSGCKSNHLEGGIRVPAIMKLPNLIEPNSTYEKSISMLDMLPTFVNMAGGDASKIKGLDGVDLLPYITGENTKRPHQNLFWKKENRGVVRQGDWKFMRFPDRPAELYNIKNDISESNNLASKYPEKVKELFKILWKWEGELERPLWALKRKYEVNAMKRMDDKRTPILDE